MNGRGYSFGGETPCSTTYIQRRDNPSNRDASFRLVHILSRMVVERTDRMAFNEKGPSTNGEGPFQKGVYQAQIFSTGAIGLASLTGEVGVVGAASTVPLMRITFSGEFTALLVTVTLLLMAPTRLVSYFTVMVVLAPGNTGSVSHLGTVQPQLPLQLVRINGALPVLVTVNSHVPLAPWAMLP